MGLDADYATQLAQLGANYFGPGSVGSAVEVTNPAGEKSVTVYDGIGRVVLQIDGNKNCTKFVYDNVVNGLVETASVDALGNTTKSRSDGAGRIREREDALTKVTAYAFDANGNLLQVRDPNSVGYDSTFDYRNRELSRTDTHSDLVFSRTYDGNNNLKTQTDSLSHTTTFAYDGRDRKISATDRLSSTTAFAYDANSNLVSLIDAETRQTTYVYDPRNLLIAETFPQGDSVRFPDVDSDTDGYPDARTRKYAYDATRRLTQRFDQFVAPAAQPVIGYQYDMANRLLNRHYPDNMDDSFTYDAASRLLTATSGRYLNVVTRNYSANNEKAGRLQSETLAISNQNYTTSYGYAANNLQTSVTYPNGDVVSRTFTARYQLETVAYNTVAVTSAIAYDDGMRKTSTTFGNGRVEGRTYRTDNLSNTIATDGNTTSFTYSWDSNKRKTAETNNLFAAQTNTYGGYDNEDRLTSFARGNGDTQTWSLSLVGDWNSTTINNVQQNRTHDNVHELTAINANALTYDQKGNLTYNANDGRSFVWDYENRLFETYTWDGDITVNCYDALGRRVLHQDISNDWMTFNLTVLVSDGLQEIAEYPQFGNASSPKRTYVYGAYIDEPLMMVDYTGEAPAKYYYHANDLYSVAALTDSAGNVVERYKYDAYGKVTILASDGVTIRASSAYNNPWTFTGRRLDAESGLMYYRARFYSTELGRFIGRDPILNNDAYQWAYSKLLQFKPQYNLTAAAYFKVTEASSRALNALKDYESLLPSERAVLTPSQRALFMRKLAQNVEQFNPRQSLYEYASSTPSSATDPSGMIALHYGGCICWCDIAGEAIPLCIVPKIGVCFGCPSTAWTVAPKLGADCCATACKELSCTLVALSFYACVNEGLESAGCWLCLP